MTARGPSRIVGSMKFFAVSPDRLIPITSIRVLRRDGCSTQVSWGDGSHLRVDVVPRAIEEITDELEGHAPRPRSRDARLLAARAAARSTDATYSQRLALDHLLQIERLLGLDGLRDLP